MLSLRGTDLDAARAHAATAVRLSPESFDCWMTYAYVLRRRGDYPAARDAYQRAAALRPTSPVPMQGLQDLDRLEHSR